MHLLNWAIGLALIDHCDFERAVESLRAAERSVGMLVVSPLKIEGDTGCLVNPLLVV